MRILTVRQPWAWAIIHGGKDVENRVRNIAGDYRGPVAIHVAMADAEGAPENIWLEYADFYRNKHGLRPSEFSWRDTERGHIIGVVELVAVHASKLSASESFLGAPVCFDSITPTGNLCSVWAEPNHHHLILDAARALAEPIPYRGALGLRTLPDDTANSVMTGVIND